MNFLEIMVQPADSPYCSDDFRASILVETLRGFVEINRGLNSFPEMFLPISTLLHQIEKQEKIPQTLKEKLEDVAKLIKFEENFVKGRDYDAEKFRSDIKKLKRKLKQETKGAVCELHKGSYFMSEVKAKEKDLQEQERTEKHDKAPAFLQQQEHAFKSGRFVKAKARREDVDTKHSLF